MSTPTKRPIKTWMPVLLVLVAMRISGPGADEPCADTLVWTLGSVFFPSAP